MRDEEAGGETAVADIELAAGGGEVIVDRRVGKAEALPHLLGAEAGENEAQTLPLSRREGFQT